MSPSLTHALTRADAATSFDHLHKDQAPMPHIARHRPRIAAPLLLVLCLAPLPAKAWDIGAEGLICTLTHATPDIVVRLTYDPALPEYSITLTTPAPWPDFPIFALRFDGDQAMAIQTPRHVLSDGNRALTVTDGGFGNVLDGLQFNTTAMAVTGDATVTIPLDGAAPAVAAFRDCGGVPSV